MALNFFPKSLNLRLLKKLQQKMNIFKTENLSSSVWFLKLLQPDVTDVSATEGNSYKCHFFDGHSCPVVTFL